MQLQVLGTAPGRVSPGWAWILPRRLSCTHAARSTGWRVVPPDFSATHTRAYKLRCGDDMFLVDSSQSIIPESVPDFVQFCLSAFQEHAVGIGHGLPLGTAQPFSFLVLIPLYNYAARPNVLEVGIICIYYQGALRPIFARG
jgi:hypothetical protein